MSTALLIGNALIACCQMENVVSSYIICPYPRDSIHFSFASCGCYMD